jgi:hypothetical protein
MCRSIQAAAGLASAAWPVAPKLPGSDETVSLGREIGLKRIPAITAPIKQRGSIMLAIILNSIYRQFLRSSLSGMRKFAAG